MDPTGIVVELVLKAGALGLLALVLVYLGRTVPKLIDAQRASNEKTVDAMREEARLEREAMDRRAAEERKAFEDRARADREAADNRHRLMLETIVSRLERIGGAVDAQTLILRDMQKERDR